MIAGLQMLKGQKTIGQRVEEYGQVVKKRLFEEFEKKGISYPPKGMVLIGLKSEKVLEVWISQNQQNYSLLKTYPILKTSGQLGPKLREGDLQVPEGIYRIESLNPNSRFHLSLRINYPNDFDRQMAQQDGRTGLGGDIMIHGAQVSVGCLAMGDSAAEDLFLMAA
jgi:murein L,D-transpeptidase YafK